MPWPAGTQPLTILNPAKAVRSFATVPRIAITIGRRREREQVIGIGGIGHLAAVVVDGHDDEHPLVPKNRARHAAQTVDEGNGPSFNQLGVIRDG